jgi:phosphatidate cytidylyltransferase
MSSSRRPPDGPGRRPPSRSAGGAGRRPPSRSAGGPKSRRRRPDKRRPAARDGRRAAQKTPAAGERRQRSDLLARAIVAIPAAILLIIFIDLGGLAFAVFMIVAGWACMHELYRLLHRWRPLALIGFASLAAMVIAARDGGSQRVLEVAVATLPVLFIFALARERRERITLAIAATLLGVYWIGFAFAHAELLRQVPHGNGVLIDILVGTFLADTGAYLGGRLFGRRRLAPDISPNKTVEGLFCGMFVAVVAVFFAGLYQSWMTQGDALLLGVSIAILAPLGDLFESVVKREAGIKDTGTLFGAHGGALDRLDSVMFTVVAGYYIWLAVMQ